MTWVLLGGIPLFIYAYWVILAWRATRREQHSRVRREPLDEWLHFTLIMAFRNERAHLRAWGSAIEEWWTVFPNMQVVLVDDGSTDGSSNEIEHLKNHANYKLLTTVGVGKKEAIQKAVVESSGEVLLFTDADVTPKKEWVSAMLQPFTNDSLQMALGPVVYAEGPTFKNRLMTLDFLALMISSELAVLLQRPVMANGANLAVRRATRVEASEGDLQMDIASGDDVFLLHYISKKHGPHSIEFIRDKAACLETPPPQSWRAFVKQRLRWGGKSSSYRDSNAQGLTVLVFLTNLSLPVLLFVNWKVGAVAWIIKMILDYQLLRKAVAHYGRTDALSVFFLQSVLYPFYITLLGLASQLLPVKWKDS